MFINARNEFAFLKAGIFGFAGSGKTRTASEIAIGLHKFAKLEKPVGFIDTEIGSDCVSHFFEENKINLKVLKTRAFVDLIKGMSYAEKEFSILIIDSITHFWIEIAEAYKRRKKLDRIYMHHWADIKSEWGRFTDAFLLSKLHVIQCGRAGFVYSHEKDEEGFNQLIKTNVKMKAESETEFEPPLVIEMIQEFDIKDVKKRAGSAITHKAWVIKDRYHDMTGQCLINPKFEDFLPHVKKINLNGKHLGYDPEKSSEGVFDSPDWSRIEKKKRTDILLEEIKDNIVTIYPGADAKSKEDKKKLLRDFFGTSSWTAIQDFSLEKLEEAHKKIIELLHTKEATNGN